MLVGYDANGIQDFITSGNRPVLMSGASRIVSAFDAEMRAQPGCLFAGGGRGRFLVPRGEEEALRRALSGGYWDRTSGEVLGMAHVPFQKEQEASAMKHLARLLRIAKDEAPPPKWAEWAEQLCEGCFRAAQGSKEITRPPPESPVKLCDRCYVLWDRAEERRRQRRLQMSELSSDGRVATVAADGNGMGAVFDGLSRLETMALLSAAVRSSFQEAAEEAQRHVEATLGEKVLTLVTGGDDVKAFLSPLGLGEFILTLVRAVEEKTCARFARVEGLGRERVALGIGALVSHDHYPAARLVDMSNDLERLAKRPGSGGSAVGFHVMGSSSELIDGMLEDARAFPVGDEDNRQGWEELVRRAKALSKLPSAQRAWFNALLREGAQGRRSAEELQNALGYQVARSEAWQAYFRVAVGTTVPPPDELEKGLPCREEFDLAAIFSKARDEVRS